MTEGVLVGSKDQKPEKHRAGFRAHDILADGHESFSNFCWIQTVSNICLSALQVIVLRCNDIAPLSSEHYGSWRQC